MNQLIIVGASGHGRVVADIAKLNGYKNILFLDDDKSLGYCGKYKVVGETAKAIELPGDVIVGIGDSSIRQRFCENYKDRLVTLIHPDAVIADDVEINIGSVVMAGVIINPGSRIGVGCIINTSSSVDHGCRIGDYAHISVGAHISGAVNIGSSTWVGIGAVVSNNVNICNNCMIGAGAVVVKDIEEPGTYVGVPAKRAEERLK